MLVGDQRDEGTVDDLVALDEERLELFANSIEDGYRIPR